MINRFQSVSQSGEDKLATTFNSERVVLIGFMGVGKSVVGRLCADILGYDFCDTDAMVESRAGKSISDIFDSDGEPVFRRLEREALAEAVSRPRVVIATGGGAPMDAGNQLTIKSAGTVVLLTAEPHTIAQRIGDPGSRPLLAGAADAVARIKHIMRKRKRAYAAVSDYIVAADGRQPDEVAQAVIERVAEASTRTKKVISLSSRLDVALEGAHYPIWLGSGLIRDGGGTILAETVGATRTCIVTHTHLRRLYADPLATQMRQNGFHVAMVTIPQGESRKNLKTVERLYSSFVAAGLDRKGVVVALGGGVIGDIAGFAAACYLRGIRCVQVPTTLLAQVDSSVGGKTGVDLPEGKNLVGAFHQPSLVLIDPQALNSLPERELRSGLAEVIKYGIITDNPFFYQTRDELTALLNCESSALQRAIMRSCEIKAEVVTEDEKEQGLRAILNFGHTVGHALESATQYRLYRHGEAIAIGMVTACLIGEELGITPPGVTLEVSDCLATCGLPVEFPGSIDTAAIHAAMLLDKKTRSGRLRFVIAERIGKVSIVDDVPPECVDRAIQRQKPS